MKGNEGNFAILKSGSNLDFYGFEQLNAFLVEILKVFRFLKLLYRK